jgi:hypothetical protein
MIFDHNGTRFKLDFSTGKRLVQVGTIRHGTKVNDKELVYADSLYPYTTAKLLEVNDTQPEVMWRVHAEATVGCHPQDVYSEETGRLAAMHKLGKLVAPELMIEMWKCYTASSPVKTAMPKGAEE